MEREEIEHIADEMIARYDEVYFEVMNRIVEEVRANIARTAISNTLDPVFPPEQE